MAWISIGMTTLLCVSCGAGQTTQLFHSFAFDSGPHIVCVACSNSQTRHVFDEAAAAQHSANIDNVNYTQSRVTASEQRIIDLENQLKLTREQYERDTALVSTLQDAISIDRVKQLQAWNQKQRWHMKTSMPLAIRSILPPANDRYLAYLMGGNDRLGKDSPVYVLPHEVLDITARKLLPTVSLDQEMRNCDDIDKVLDAIGQMPEEQRLVLYSDMYDQKHRQRLTMEQLSYAHCNIFGIVNHDCRQTLKFAMTSATFSSNPLYSWEPTITAGAPAKRKTGQIIQRLEEKSINYIRRLKDNISEYQDGLTDLNVTNAYGVSREVPVCMLVFEVTDMNTEEEEIGRQFPCYMIEIDEADGSSQLCCCVSHTYPDGTTLDDDEDDFQNTTHVYFLYNIGDEDLVLAPGTVKASFGMHNGDLISYCEDNPKHQHRFSDCIIPAKGIGNIGSLEIVFDVHSLKKHILDASNARILTLEVHT